MKFSLKMFVKAIISTSRSQSFQLDHDDYTFFKQVCKNNYVLTNIKIVTHNVLVL